MFRIFKLLTSVLIGCTFALMSFAEGTSIDFNNGIVWKNTGDLYWEIGEGRTNSRNTGPRYGASLGSDKYAYMETSERNDDYYGAYYPRINAELTSKIFQVQPRTLFTLKYYMYGEDTGELAIQIQSEGVYETIWSRSGEQQDTDIRPWRLAILQLDKYAGERVRIRIVATAAGGHRGDIAIDEIKINK